MKKLLLLGLCAVVLAGCATPPVTYYYGRYSQTLYRSVKDGTAESLAKHKVMLEDIMATSEKKGYRVPPGIYCEYGYILAKEGNAAADRYFSLEVKTYPESEKFVSFLRTQLKPAKS